MVFCVLRVLPKVQIAPLSQCMGIWFTGHLTVMATSRMVYLRRVRPHFPPSTLLSPPSTLLLLTYSASLHALRKRHELEPESTLCTLRVHTIYAEYISRPTKPLGPGVPLREPYATARGYVHSIHPIPLVPEPTIPHPSPPSPSDPSLDPTLYHGHPLIEKPDEGPIHPSAIHAASPYASISSSGTLHSCPP